jgi:hypothetical protein
MPKEMSFERQRAQELARKMHESNLRAGRYSQRTSFPITWSTPKRIGPWELPTICDDTHQAQPDCGVCVIDPPTNSIFMLNDGRVTILNPKSKRFEVFDFRRGDVNKLHVIKPALEKAGRTWGSVPTYYSDSEAWANRKNRNSDQGN